MEIKREYLKDGREIDFTSHYHTATRKYIHGRLSLRRRNGKYEVYVYWFRLRKEEVLYSSDDFRAAVEFANEEMHRLGYEWDDVVID